MKLKLFSLIIFALFLCASVPDTTSRFAFAGSGSSVDVKFIATADVHGSLFPFDFVENKQSDHSLAQAYSYVQQQRKNKRQQVVLIDVGDILQGTPVVYYYNYEAEKKTHICADIMNFMK